mmetsp:Transcript_4546/g.10938  ORF Transcript_4546/g.10938 Transcript_4546/m.10938 type:complete len:209 (+) Transcript_4546:53-679(+)
MPPRSGPTVPSTAPSTAHAPHRRRPWPRRSIPTLLPTKRRSSHRSSPQSCTAGCCPSEPWVCWPPRRRRRYLLRTMLRRNQRGSSRPPTSESSALDLPRRPPRMARVAGPAGPVAAAGAAGRRNAGRGGSVRCRDAGSRPLLPPRAHRWRHSRDDAAGRPARWGSLRQHPREGRLWRRRFRQQQLWAAVDQRRWTPRANRRLSPATQR